MNPERILAIIDKEWTQTCRSAGFWVAAVLPPALTAAVLLGVLRLLLRTHEGQVPGWVLDAFLMCFTAAPAVMAARTAAAGIMADKISRSLEPQLATPLTAAEVLIGKLIVAVTPPVVATWVATSIAIRMMADWNAVQSALLGRITGAFAIGTVFAVTLMLAHLAALMAVLIASRKTEPRDAALSSTGFAEIAMILPVGSVYYACRLKVAGTAWAAELLCVLILANAILFFLGLKLFQRETVLFKWK